MNLDKKALRKRVKAVIDRLPKAYIKESDEGIFRQLISLEAFKNHRSYLPITSLTRP